MVHYWEVNIILFVNNTVEDTAVIYSTLCTLTSKCGRVQGDGVSQVVADQTLTIQISCICFDCLADKALGFVTCDMLATRILCE